MMLVKLFGSKARVLGQASMYRPLRSMQTVEALDTAAEADRVERASAQGSMSNVIRMRKGFYRPYENYAPIFFEWSQQIVNNETTLDQLVKSSKFRKISNAVCDTTRHSDKNILNLVKSLIVMRMDPEDRLVRFLENELIFKLDDSDFKLLVQTFNLFYHVSDTSERRKDLLGLIKAKINEKLDHTEPNILNLLQLVKVSQHLPADTLIKIEDQITKILDQQDDIALDVLCYLLVLLSRYNRRNKPLIRTTVNKLLKYRPEDIYSVPPHLIHMICSLNRLNYPEVNLLEKCSDILINADFLSNTNESAKRDFLVAISQLNFSYPKLFDYYLHNLTENPESFNHQDLVTITITLSRLHYQNKEIAEVIRSQVMPRCSNQEQFLSKSQWFNYINALALLECVTEEQLKTILNLSFLREMEHEEIENHLIRIKEREDKLLSKLNISSNNNEETAASEPTEESLSIQNIYHIMNMRRKYLTLSGLILTQKRQTDANIDLDNIFDSPQELEEFEAYINQLEFTPFKKSKDLESFRQTIFKSLDSFAPLDKYTKTNVFTPFGFVIDATLVIDSQGNPVPLREEDQVDKLSCTSKSVPGNAEHHRVALMTIGFNDTLLDSSSTLIGPKQVETRILQCLGFKVVCVHQNSIPNYSASSNLNRIKFLQNLIVSHVQV